MNNGTSVRHAPRGRSSGSLALALGALGVVFGDIGTSPLYALPTVFDTTTGAISPTRSNVFGVISLVVWSVTSIVTMKYVGFVLRADNDGEGGVLALAARIRQSASLSARQQSLTIGLGVLGAALFFGDSLITPAISVMSAMEGLEVSAPAIAEYSLAFSVVLLVGLFVIQRFGTNVVGVVFGPVMLVWFATLAGLGLASVAKDPSIIAGLSPTYAVALLLAHPVAGFVTLGAVVLTITGAEALYADMGHFGRRPISRAWIVVVFPSLVLNYLGQGAFIIANPDQASGAFFRIAPAWAQWPLVVLAALATLIASQAVISGSFSVAREAMRLGYLPRLDVRSTSPQEKGQIYIPVVNWMLLAGVMALLLLSKSSANLAAAYGLAVTGTLLVTTALFTVYVAKVWAWTRVAMVAFFVPIVAIELAFFASATLKFAHGGWLPLAMASVVAAVMLTWHQQSELLSRARSHVEGDLVEFVDWLHTDPVTKVPGTAVFLHPNDSTVPLALKENTRLNKVIHERVIIVNVETIDVRYVSDDQRYIRDTLGDPYDAVDYVTLRYGFRDIPDIPRALQLVDFSPEATGLELDPMKDNQNTGPFAPDSAYYFLSHTTVDQHPQRGVVRACKHKIFGVLAHNAHDASEYYGLPIKRTITVSAQVTI